MQRKELKNNGTYRSGFSAGGIGVYTIPKSIYGETQFNAAAEADLVSNKMIDSFNKKYPSPTTKQLHDFENAMQQKVEERMNFKSDSIHKELSKDVYTYLALKGYNLKDDDTRFYLQNDANYLAVVKWDTTVNNNGAKNEYGHYEAKPIKVRYASESKLVLIPISKTTGSILNIVIWAFGFLAAVLTLYFFLGLPILFLINISKGKAFTEANIRILKQISTVSLIIAVLAIATPYIFRLFFWKTIPEELVPEPLMSRITDNLPLLFIMVVTFFISIAFKKGFKLQQEQDLTI
jgi:hypothetical protein